MLLSSTQPCHLQARLPMLMRSINLTSCIALRCWSGALGLSHAWSGCPCRALAGHSCQLAGFHDASFGSGNDCSLAGA